jgi:hypothetical protein
LRRSKNSALRSPWSRFNPQISSRDVSSICVCQKEPPRGSDDENQSQDFKVNGALTMVGDDIEIVLDVEMVRLYRQSTR